MIVMPINVLIEQNVQHIKIRKTYITKNLQQQLIICSDKTTWSDFQLLVLPWDSSLFQKHFSYKMTTTTSPFFATEKVTAIVHAVFDTPTHTIWLQSLKL